MQGTTPGICRRRRALVSSAMLLTTFNQDLSLFTSLARGCSQILLKRSRSYRPSDCKRGP